MASFYYRYVPHYIAISQKEIMNNKIARQAWLRWVAGLLLSSLSSLLYAATTQVAVAANFAEPAREIARAFAEHSGHEAVLSFGATGQFYTQITNDAPFEVFLAADQHRPQRAVDEGHGVEGSRFTYAIGQLVLYTPDNDVALDADYLQNAIFKKIAVANPRTAPYGTAAIETLKNLQVYDELKGKIIQGQNISQTFQFVQTGNAELGFVALGQVAQNEQGSSWLVPADLYQPIKQDAVLLVKGQDNPAALEFLRFLHTEPAQEIIKKYGYAVAAP